MARSRTWLALGALLTATLLSLALLSGTASAATGAVSAPSAAMGPAAMQAHSTASGCNRRICLKLEWTKVVSGGRVGGSVHIFAWPRFGGDSFDGHYQVLLPYKGSKGRAYINSGPNQIYHHSPAWSRYWGYYKGQWCVIGWVFKGGHKYTPIGEACLTI
jgi:hypothetical protein